MNLNISGMMEEMTKTSEKLVKGYELLSKMDEVEIATTPKELVWQKDLVKLYHYKRETPATCKIPVLVSFAIALCYRRFESLNGKVEFLATQ